MKSQKEKFVGVRITHRLFLVLEAVNRTLGWGYSRTIREALRFYYKEHLKGVLDK
jgi:hypothetical protein